MQNRRAHILVPKCLTQSRTDLSGPPPFYRSHCLEMVQRRGARYVSNKHNNTSSVDNMLNKLEWRTLEDRRRAARLTMLYKISNDLVAIEKSSRLVPPNRLTRNMHGKSYQIPTATNDYRKGSFFPRTIREWNALPPDIVAAKTPEAFKAKVSKM